MKNFGAAFFYLWPEVQPAASCSPPEVKPALIHVGGNVDEVAERSSCPSERPAKDGHPHTRKLEGDVLLAAVGEEIAQKQVCVDLEPVCAAPRRDDDLTSGVCRALGVLSRFEVLYRPTAGAS